MTLALIFQNESAEEQKSPRSNKDPAQPKINQSINQVNYLKNK